MGHFVYRAGQLEALREEPFKLEREMQKIVESNLHLLFDLQYVRSEFQLNELRIDTLAFDQQSNSFVIIEYKLDKRFSVVDQGFAYLALMLNNKADFVLEYNERMKSQLNKDKVDWSQSRIIFLSQSFTNYQRQAINFKDLPIELWEIKKYEDDSISLNQLISASSTESIKTISKQNTTVEKVSREVKKYTEEDHLTGVPEKVINLYNKFKDGVLSIADDITIRPRKYYIGFVAKTNFTDINLQKSKIKIFLNLKKGSIDDPKKMARDISKLGHWGNGDYDLNFADDKNLEYILSLVKQAYLKNRG